MTVAAIREPVPVRLKQPEEVPPLENGDHLDQKTFHERYEVMPENVKAELIGGIVYMASPLKRRHGRPHIRTNVWLGYYQIATPGTDCSDNTSTILSDSSEVQPDTTLIVLPECGGQTSVSETDYIVGPPELIAEIASSSESIDLHRKRDDYEREGVTEYVVVAVRQKRVFWWHLSSGKYEALIPDAEGVIRSKVFPGLWLDPVALVEMNGQRLLDVLRQGLASPEHAEFVTKLAAAKSAKTSN